MEVIKIENHPKGGIVVTIQKTKSTWTTKGGVKEVITEEWLRIKHYSWYLLPDLTPAAYNSDYEKALSTYKVRQKYGKPTKTYKPKAVGNPNRCMFCHTGLSGMAASCLKCGGAMHLSCADENKDKCITPGCKT